ncbi:MAG: cobyrinate a,c-diamide synthase [Thermoplasmata archaeon]|nr:cobyrinate a,c-diamide synthase [Candidatus Sysuiplasma jiujiangense]MBX8641329.1 cobyrinate a,c-diamide synthase [Candidatus Sysuiplasma jiujiangense]
MNKVYRGRLVVAGLSSGSGKTTVAMSVMNILRRKGIPVAPFKVGPDFLDTKYHQVAAGAQSTNIDGFMTNARYITETVAASEARGMLSVVEGMMGLFDGVRATGDFSSTAWIARLLSAPVILCMDVSATMRTAAYTALGLKRISESFGIEIAGVILNKVGGMAHFDGCRSAFLNAGIDVLGGLPYSASFSIPEIHLGLKVPANMRRIRAQIDAMSDELAETFDLKKLLLIAGSAPELRTARSSPAVKPVVKIGVASDPAFNFYYADNINLLKSAGAAICNFSPLQDSSLDEFDGLYIGGGYPELYVPEITGNGRMLNSLKEKAESGMPIYAECGGFMLLCRDIKIGRTKHRMAGIFDATVEMASSPVIGYRKIRTLSETPLGPPKTTSRGHEFHYARIVDGGSGKNDAPFEVLAGKGDKWSNKGYVFHGTVGSFIHIHFGSNRQLAKNFVGACLEYSRS